MSNIHQVKEDKLEVMSSRLVSVPEAARLLHMRPQSIYNGMALGKYRRLKVGSKTFMDREQIKEILRTALGE